MRRDLFSKGRGHGRGKVAHNLLQNIFNRYQPLNIAIFIDHQTHFLFIALKFNQLGAERRAFRDVINLICRAQHYLFGEFVFLGHQTIRFAYAQHADGVVQRIAVQHDAAMRGVGQLANNRLPVIVDINAHDLIARHHNVVNADLFQIQYRQQHILIAAGDLRVGFMHDGTQFIFAQRTADRHIPFNAYHAHQHSRHAV